MKETEGISLISVNYDVCERILNLKKRKNVTKTIIHGKPMKNEVKKEKKTERKKENEDTETKQEKKKSKKKEKKKEKLKVKEHAKDKDKKDKKQNINEKTQTVIQIKEEDTKNSNTKTREVKEYSNDNYDDNADRKENETGNEIQTAFKPNSSKQTKDMTKSFANTSDRSIYVEHMHNEPYWEKMKEEHSNRETFTKEQQLTQKEVDRKSYRGRLKTEIMSREKFSIYNEIKYNKFVRALKQQQLPKFNKLHYFYDWKTAISILSFFSVLFFLIGLYIYIESRNAVETYVPYNTEDKYKTFKISRTMKKPVYVYYKISNYFGNYKGFVSDESNNIISEYKCKYIKTFEDLYKYRCIDGKQTLPELNYQIMNNKNRRGDEDINHVFSDKNEKVFKEENENDQKVTLESCDVNKIDPELKKKNIYPCGLIAASVFNDKIGLSLNGTQLKIEKLGAVKNFDFFTYVRKRKNKENYEDWLYTYSTEYRNWSHSAMTSSFIKLYGILNEDLEKGKNYKLIFYQNTWPSGKWKAEKEFVFISLRGIGNGSKNLAYLYFIIAFIYVFVIILIIILVKCKYCRLGVTFSFCQTSASGNGNEAELLVKISKKHTTKNNQTKPEPVKVSETYVPNDPININPYDIEKIPCPCPLH